MKKTPCISPHPALPYNPTIGEEESAMTNILDTINNNLQDTLSLVILLSVETLKYLMGHTDISVTSNVYTHLKLEDAQREMERLERIEKEMKKCAK